MNSDNKGPIEGANAPETIEGANAPVTNEGANVPVTNEGAINDTESGMVGEVPQSATYDPLMNDDQVIQFCEENLAGKSVDQVTDENELQALVRYGDIIATRRGNAEVQGREAKLRIVKGKIAELEKKYAIASLIGDLASKNQNAAITGHKVEIPFVVIIEVAGEKLEVTFDSVKFDNAPSQAPINNFAKAISDIAKIVTAGVQRQYQVINNGSGGEMFNLPFDFQTPKAEIIAKAQTA